MQTRTLPDAASQLQAVFEAFPDLFLLLDNNCKILDYKAGNAAIFFTHPESSTGKQLQDTLPPQIATMFLEASSKAQATGEVNKIDFVLPLESEDHWFEARLVPLTDAHNAAVIRDVSEHKLKETRIQTQIKRLAALRSIDLAITSSLDLSLILSMLLSHVTAQLGVDAAAALILNLQTNTLEFTAGLGFHTTTLQHTHLRLGEGYAGMAALERKTIHISNLPNRKTDFLRSPMFSLEGFTDYFAIPLIAKSQVRGVMEAFNRSPLKTDPDWLDYLETLAGQAAIAIDSITMFKDLQRSNAELTLAYDATIEGWSHALDLRDRETEGHTRRVSDMTLYLARLMNIEEETLIHIRRGAMLHDIGKMGVPDNILLKPGELDESEWAIMHQHPQYAYEMLSPISYLAPAMEIPYYHHEKWDGTGYPDGLYGDQIPQAARVFAVADVYDALTSDRPYRSAWSCEKAREYIQAEAGRHFDPHVAETFLTRMPESLVRKEKQEAPNQKSGLIH